MTDKSAPGRHNADMSAHFRKYKPTNLMESSAAALASSMRCLEDTMELLESSRAVLNTPGAMRQVCWICGKGISLTTCKIDEHGSAVHEECYVAKVAFTNESLKLSKIADN